MSALWIEFDLKALLDGPPGWIDLDEWDRSAVQVGNNAEKWYGPQFSNLNKSLKMPPGQSIRDSVNPTVVSERLSAKQEELRSVELKALGPLQDVLHGVLAGKDKYQVAYDALGVWGPSTGETGMGFTIGTDSIWSMLAPWNLFRGEGSVHLTKGDALTPAARARADELLLNDSIETWSLMISTIETVAHLEPKDYPTGYEFKLRAPVLEERNAWNQHPLYTQAQVRAASTIFFREPGDTQWVHLSSLKRGVEHLRRFRNLHYLRKDLGSRTPEEGEE
jgi:hypothetical protein